jgi:hypothetical protein
MKRLRSRESVSNINPLQNNLAITTTETGEMPTPSDICATDVTIANIVLSISTDVTPAKNSDANNINQIQDNMDISTHLRPRPLSMVTQALCSTPYYQ